MEQKGAEQALEDPEQHISATPHPNGLVRHAKESQKPVELQKSTMKTVGFEPTLKFVRTVFEHKICPHIPALPTSKLFELSCFRYNLKLAP